MNQNPKIDEYISNSAEFAQPLLVKLRDLIHQANPDIEESIKWGMPCFDYKGIVCHMAGFKNHCSFGFMKHKLIRGLEDNGMNSFGKLKLLTDLPKDELIITYIKETVLLNEQGVKAPKVSKSKMELVVPNYIIELLRLHPKAEEVFNDFSYSHKKEYVEWIVSAKREATRENRMNQMLEWLSEGKHKNWKYENC